MSDLPAAPLLLHPDAYDPAHFDDETRRLLRATIEHFESRGKARLTADFHAHEYHEDFLAFVKQERLFATFLTPAEQADGDVDKRWDTARIAAMSEVLGFYGVSYWYPAPVQVPPSGATLPVIVPAVVELKLSQALIVSCEDEDWGGAERTPIPSSSLTIQIRSTLMSSPPSVPLAWICPCQR